MEKAVIDRFEGDVAVLLLQEGEKHLNAPRAALPPGAKEGDWLKVELQGEKVIKAELDPAETAARRQKAIDLLNKLRQKK